MVFCYGRPRKLIREPFLGRVGKSSVTKENDFSKASNLASATVCQGLRESCEHLSVMLPLSDISVRVPVPMSIPHGSVSSSINSPLGSLAEEKDLRSRSVRELAF